MRKVVLPGQIDRRTRDTNNFIFAAFMMFVFSLVATFIMVFLFGGGDMEEFKEFRVWTMIQYIRTPGFNWEKGKVGIYAGIILFLILFCYAYMDYERKKNSRVGEEYGSAKLLTAKDLPMFKKLFFYDPKIVKKYYPKVKTFYDKLQLKKICKIIPGVEGKIYSLIPPLFANKRTTRKMESEAFLNSQIMGSDVYLSMNCKFINRNLNTITIGGSGQGKSYSELFPNALMGTCNYIFTDPSGEILLKIGHFLEDIKDYRIKVFNIDEMFKSHKYNPLLYISTEADYPDVVEALNKNIKPSKGAGANVNEFFDDAKDALMCALIALLKELYRGRKIKASERDSLTVEALCEITGTSDERLEMIAEEYGGDIEKIRQRLFEINDLHIGKQTLKNIMRLLEMAEQEVNESGGATSKLDSIFERLREHDPRSYAAAQWKAFKVGGPKVCNEVIISATAVFSRFFNTDDLEWLTCRDELNLEELATEQPCALFIVTPAASKTYNFLASMIYSQVFTIVTKMGKNYAEERGQDNPALPRHLSLWLDEFANIGKIPQFLELLSVVRKYNISINVIVQTLSQLKGMYKDDHETVVGNCDTMIYLGGQEASTIKALSEKIGKETIKAHDYALGRNGHETYKNTGRNLLTPDEIETMARAHELVFITGCKPIQTTKYDLTKHPNYKHSGEADPENLYDVSKISRGNEIDFAYLDERAVTVEEINNFDFTMLDVKAGHVKGVVVSNKWRKFSQPDLIKLCKFYKIEIENEGKEAAYYGRLLDAYDEEHGTKDAPVPVKDKKNGTFSLPKEESATATEKRELKANDALQALSDEEKKRMEERIRDIDKYSNMDFATFVANNVELYSLQLHSGYCPEHEFINDDVDFAIDKVNLD